MIHIALHFMVPLMVAFTFYRDRWQSAVLIMVATMLVDADHLLADPIYDPERCSIGFHPLHIMPAIAVYAGLFLIPLVWRRRDAGQGMNPKARVIHIVGLGLVIHMLLDWLDCFL